MSWKFFGFCNKFIDWIRLFNNDISACIVQCGHLSQKIKVGRGCRQGEPISAYIFLLAAEILALLILLNEDISGLKVNTEEFKLTPFADYTTFILDGSSTSLQAALNTLEIYGSMSGLKMNKEKTKMIWIGRKRFTKEKLSISTKLNWGNTEFNLLGIEFSTNLKIISEINYNKAYKKMEAEIEKWKYRYLTPIGRICLIKTNIISKVVHLLTILPTPESFFKKLISSYTSFYGMINQIR